MDFYIQAAGIVHKSLAQHSSMKSLCLAKSTLKKKETMAIVYLTLENLQAIDSILEDIRYKGNVHVSKNNQKTGLNTSLLRVLICEAVYGKGLHGIGGIAEHVQQEVAVRKSFSNHITKKPTDRANKEIHCRINYLKHKEIPEKTLNLLDRFKDTSFTDLITVPCSVLSPRHPLVTKGYVIIQSKPSCLPAHAICEAVDSFSHVVDATASPGNKTVHLCGLYKLRQEASQTPLKDQYNGKFHVIALEKNFSRFETLRKRVQILGATEMVTCLHGDFLEFRWLNAEVIICDPSCSAGREVDGDRLVNLVRFQIRLLLHALLSFPSAKCVSYSTCSDKVFENELVVSMALCATSYHGWKLHYALPQHSHRGEEISPSILKSFYEKCYPFESVYTGMDMRFISQKSAGKCLRHKNPSPFFVAVFTRSPKKSI